MRARNIKPGFFENEVLAELDPLARLLFAGLWCYCDKEGRFEWRPKRIKALLLPYDKTDIERHLDALTSKDFIRPYQINGNKYGVIPKFLEHQNPHPHEAKSKIPEPNQCHEMSLQCHEMSVKCNAESLNPESLNPESLNQEYMSETVKPFLTIPLKDKEHPNYSVTEEKVKEWEGLFPGLDIEQCLRECKAWNDANPDRRKTKRGIEKHIVAWLTKANDRGRNRRSGYGYKTDDSPVARGLAQFLAEEDEPRGNQDT